MPQFTLNDLANNAGQATANAGINLAKQAKGLACDLYKNYNGWATTFGLGTAPPAAFVHGVWDTVCADNPGGLPSKPTPQFQGGQCQNCYNIYLEWDVYDGSTFTQTYPSGQKIIGPIGGSRITYPPGGGYQIQILCCGGCFYSFQPTPQVWHTFIDSTGSHLTAKNLKLVNNGITSGAPDNCGNPPPPPPDTSPPPPGALTQNYTLNFNDGDSITVPLTFAQMNNDLDIIVDVGGVGFNFNVDGVSFNWNFDPNGQPNLPPGGGGSGGGNSGGGGSSNNYQLNAKLDNITNKIDNKVDIKLDDVILDINLVKDKLDSPNDCCPEPPDPDTQTAIVCPIDDGNTYTGIKDLVSVKLDVTKLPLSSKIQFGNGSPNVLFAGWLAFTFEGQAYEREPIHFEHNLFTPPKGANGFFYCLTNGAKGRVTYYVKT